MNKKVMILVLIVILGVSRFATAQEDDGTAFELAEQGVTSNDEWEPVIQEFDGVEMVLVPAGSFMMGSTEDEIDEALALCNRDNDGGCQRVGFEPEARNGDNTQVFTEPFWIDKLEVTQGQLAEWDTEHDSNSEDADLPVGQITWFEARDFCELRGARLPSEAEWEYAARGPDVLTYTWGHSYISENVIGKDDPTYGDISIAPVGSRPDGASWVGALDMIGNVWEWTSSLHLDYPYTNSDGRENDADENTDMLRVLRGGSFDVSTYGLRATYRGRRSPNETDYDFGFRCVRSYDPQSNAQESDEAVFELAEQGVISNDEWEPVIQEFDGVEMVLVPSGCFMMGISEDEMDYAISLAGDRSWYSDEAPSHEICFNMPFWIDRYEVSNEQFDTFGGEAARAGQWTDPSFPRDLVTWHEALNFCEQRGASLPTEAEWEYAARGPDSLIFPWGSIFDGSKVNYVGSEDGYEFAAPVTAFENGKSWVGAYQMSGNVWEFVSSAYSNNRSQLFAYPYQSDDGREDLSITTHRRGIRGGTWTHVDWAQRASNRGWPLPGAMDNEVGFRCARSYSNE